MKLHKIFLSAGVLSLCLAPFSNTHADIISCDDITIDPNLQSIFEQNSCHICEVSDAEVTTTYADGGHSAEVTPLEIRWKNEIEPSTKVCADLDEMNEEEKEECRADQLIYENEQVGAEIISDSYSSSFDPVDQNEFWQYNLDDVLWLPYDGQNEFYLSPNDEILFKKTNNNAKLVLIGDAPANEEFVVIKQPIIYRELIFGNWEESDEPETYNTCLGISITKGEEPEVEIEIPEVEMEEEVSEEDLLGELLGELLEEEDFLIEEEIEIPEEEYEEEPEIDLNAAGPVEITSDQTDVDAGAEHMILIVLALVAAGAYLKRRKTA